jgi:phage terminase small subunit
MARSVPFLTEYYLDHLRENAKKIWMSKKGKESKAEELTGKQKRFCEEYIFDFNATRAYKETYPDAASEDGIRASASALLTNPNIQNYIKELQSDLEKTSGISRLKVLREYEKLAFSSIAHLHDTWITRKELEKLTDDQKSAIMEIQTQTRVEMKYNPETEEQEPVQVDFVKIKLHDKQRALDSIGKMLGFNAPDKVELKDVTQKQVMIIGGQKIEF